VILPVDAVLRREVEAHRLRFTCESCVHHAPAEAAAPERCSLGFPHEPHTRATFDASDAIAFCKAFELS
jgi:hypothetical protein